MKRKLMLLLACLFVGIGLVTAQNQKVTGVVISEEDGQPVVGASVLVKGTTIGTITDIDGNFTLSNVPSSAKTLQVSYIGMKAQEVGIKPNLKVLLKSDTQQIDEVMVVAFGTAKKSAFTGSAAVVGTEELSKRITTNVQDALVGSVAGLQMRGGSGAPGSGSGSINIRGIASMYAETDPLIIVDGAPYSENLSNIPQSDIESISVLKDAASASLYGARGAAGVIIVTTKKGKSQKTTINVDAKWGVNSRAVQDYDVITDPGAYYESVYAQFNNYFINNNNATAEAANKSANSNMLKFLSYNVYTLPTGESLIGMNGKLNPNATLGRKYTYNDKEYYMTPDNWTDEAYRNALRQEYTVSINGATDKSSFYASLGYLDEEGVLQNSSYDRVSARVRADYEAKKWLKIGANASYVHSNQNSNPNLSTDYGASNVMYFVSRIAPIYPLYVRNVDADGNIVIAQNSRGDDLYDYGVASTGYGVTRPFSATGNPLAANRYNTNKVENNQLNASFTLDGNITDYLKYNVTSTVIWGQTQDHDYLTSAEGPSAGANGSLTKGNTTTVRTNNIQNLTYFKDFGRHSVNVMLGHEYYKITSKYLTGSARGEFSPFIQEINTYATIANATSYQTAYNVEGYFGNVQYNYDEKYFASASYRRDASSRFAKENRWGNFWSVGGAWLLSKENFLSDYKWIDMLKLKLSVGQQGNDNIGNFAYTDLYSLSKYNATTMVPAFYRLGNKDITWETTTNINFGIEFGLWQNRLTGNVDIYTKKTTDLLFWLSVPESLGSRGYYGNIGDIRNTGIEFALTGALVRTRDIDWSLSLNMAHNKTKILKLPESKTKTNGGFYEDYNWFEEGGELHNYMTYAYAGVNEKGEALYYYDEDLHVNGTNNISIPGKKKSGTTNVIGEASRYASGSILPKVFGGFNTSFRYKNLDFSASFDYQLGGKVYDTMYASYMSPMSSSSEAGRNYHKDWVNSWTPENKSSNTPRWQYADKFTASGSDRFLTSASYLNFQSFTVGYTLPKFSKDISKIRIYAAGENLYFWSARKGLDPRYTYSRTESVAVYSPVRNISGGIQLTF